MSREIGGSAPELTPTAVEALKAYSWPGNVRELEAFVRRLSLTSEGPVDDARVAQVLSFTGSSPSFPRWIFEGKSFEDAVEEDSSPDG